MRPRLPLKTTLVIPLAAAILVAGASSAAGAEEEAAPLGLFPGLTSGLPPAGVLRVDTAEELVLPDEAVLEQLRAMMDPADREMLDLLMTLQSEQEAKLEASRVALRNAQGEIATLVDDYLLGDTPFFTPTTAPLDTGSTPAETTTTLVPLPADLFQVGPGWLFPIAGPHSFTDTWGAPRFSGGYHPHRGTDIFCARNTPLVAVVDGVIGRANHFDTGLGGRTIWLRGADHHSYYYAHLESLAPGIENGTRVQAGQVIGYAGNSGNARTTSVHLHFEIHPFGGDAINPYPILRGAMTVDEASVTTTTTTATTSSTTSTTTPSTSTTPSQSTTTTGSTTTTTLPGQTTTSAGPGETTTTT